MYFAPKSIHFIQAVSVPFKVKLALSIHKNIYMISFQCFNRLADQNSKIQVLKILVQEDLTDISGIDKLIAKT